MFNQLQNKIRKFFGISRTEANGFTILFICVLILIITPLIYRQYGKGGYDQYQEDLALLDSVVQHIQLLEDQTIAEHNPSDPITKNLDFFNPNEVSFHDMIRMGFDSMIAKRIVKYRKSGGKFFYQEDVLKIYDFPIELYHQINSYISLPVKERNSHVPDKQSSPYSPISNSHKTHVLELLFDLNEVDSSQLILIKGIGPVLSKRIIKYREMLGGYTHTEQLDEVYGLHDESLITLKNSVYIDSLFVPVKIRINFADWRELVKHPYIQSDFATRILQNISKEGPFVDADDFEKRLMLSDSIKGSLIPYIHF